MLLKALHDYSQRHRLPDDLPLLAAVKTRGNLAVLKAQAGSILEGAD